MGCNKIAKGNGGGASVAVDRPRVRVVHGRRTCTLPPTHPYVEHELPYAAKPDECLKDEEIKKKNLSLTRGESRTHVPLLQNSGGIIIYMFLFSVVLFWYGFTHPN